MGVGIAGHQRSEVLGSGASQGQTGGSHLRLSAGGSRPECFSRGLWPLAAPAHTHTSEGGVWMGQFSRSLWVFTGGGWGRVRQGPHIGIRECACVCVCVCACVCLRVKGSMWQREREQRF